MEQLRLYLGDAFRERTEEEHERWLLRDIELKVFMNLKLGFDSEVLEVLDDSDAPSKKIDALKSKIDPGVLLHLFNMANSVYFGKQRMGDSVSFLDVVMRLGMRQTKIFILAFSLFGVSHEREFRIVSARSVATMLLARIIGVEAGYRKDVQEKLEIGGLFYEMGKILMHLYRRTAGTEVFKDSFIEKHHHVFGAKIVERFKLPRFIGEIVMNREVKFDEDSFDMASLVMMVNSIVNESFRKYGKLVVYSPKIESAMTSTAGMIIKDQFGRMGLGDFVDVVDFEAIKKPSA